MGNKYDYFCELNTNDNKELNLLEKIFYLIGGGKIEDKLYAISLNKKEAEEFVSLCNDKNRFKIDIRTQTGSYEKIRFWESIIKTNHLFLKRFSYKGCYYLYLRNEEIDQLQEERRCNS